MDKITSFQKDHNKLDVGFYESSRIKNVITYDLRMKKPNQNDFLSTKSMHTIEHMLATALRNSSQKENVVYFGPMGCRTGFYLLVFDLSFDESLKLIKESIKICLALNDVPGSEKIECGNYLDHNLNEAKADLLAYLLFITNFHNI